MIPSDYALLDVMPLNENGKVDRRALSATATTRAARPTGTPPETPLEVLVAECFARCLHVEPIGRETHFFEAGGNSLKAVACVQMIEARSGSGVTLAQFYRAPTPALVARALSPEDSLASQLTRPRGEQWSGSSRGDVLVWFPPVSGWGLVYAEIIAHLPEQRHLLLDFWPQGDRLHAYADRLEAIDLAPGQSMHLLGYSGGGNLAVEVAALLERRGARPVSSVVLFDTRADSRHLPDDPDALRARMTREIDQGLEQGDPALREIIAQRPDLRAAIDSRRIAFAQTLKEMTHTEALRRTPVCLVRAGDDEGEPPRDHALAASEPRSTAALRDRLGHPRSNDGGRSRASPRGHRARDHRASTIMTDDTLSLYSSPRG